jgi:hypothetical protein
MYSTARKFSIFVLFLAALCSVSTASAQATQSGYVPVLGGAGGTIVLGTGGVGLTTGVYGCAGGGSPTITFYTSAAPNTASTAIGSYLVDSQNSILWTPQTAGTYYLSAYLALNGATSCYVGLGVTPSSTPITTSEIVNNP